MQFLVYLLIYPILWCISMLPFRVLYFVSDIVYFIVYYVIGYRKKTVRGNLKLAFPNKTEAERLQIEKDSFKHLCDMFLEMAKTMTISRRQIDKRFKFNNLDTYLELEKKGKVLHCYVLIMLVMNGLYH